MRVQGDIMVCRIIQLLLDISAWLVVRFQHFTLPSLPVWEVDLGGKDVIDVLFIRLMGGKYTYYHVINLIQQGKNAIIVDGTSEQLVVKEVNNVERVISKISPDYLVKVYTTIGYKEGNYKPTGYNCAILTKKLLGITATGIYTPEQLLSHLWELRTCK